MSSTFKINDANRYQNVRFVETINSIRLTLQKNSSRDAISQIIYDLSKKSEFDPEERQNHILNKPAKCLE